MKFGLTQEQFDYIRKTVVEPLDRLGVKTYCFGSRSIGQHRPFSDLDLLLESQSDSDELRTLISNIKEKLETENFPYKIDLVLESELASSYREQVNRQKRSFV